MVRLRTLPIPALCLALLTAMTSCLAAQAPQKPSPAPAPPRQEPVDPDAVNLKDRVLAVVDEDPILRSDLERVIALGLAERREGEDETAFRRRVLDGLIEQRLRFQEMDRFGFEQVPVEEVEANVAAIRDRFPDQAAFQEALRTQGMTLKDLRQLVARQLMVMTYVDEQLGPRVFVSLDDITDYYRNVLTPQLQRAGQTVPPLEDVREDIRLVLRERRLNEALEKWTEELRREADIQVYLDQPEGGLPPVVKRVERPPVNP